MITDTANLHTDGEVFTGSLQAPIGPSEAS